MNQWLCGNALLIGCFLSCFSLLSGLESISPVPVLVLDYSSTCIGLLQYLHWITPVLALDYSSTCIGLLQYLHWITPVLALDYSSTCILFVKSTVPVYFIMPLSVSRRLILFSADLCLLPRLSRHEMFKDIWFPLSLE